MTFRTRFAPSPTGPLHLGHAFSALLAADLTEQHPDGAFLLRIEDIDQGRARASWEQQIYDDLAWLGLRWPEPVMRQSDRGAAYAQALDGLWDRGLLYPCSCTRRDIEAASTAPQEGAPVLGPDGVIYPGTCRPLAPPTGPRPRDVALRLNLRRALPMVPERLRFREDGHGPAGETGDIGVVARALIGAVGDIVLARRDMGTSYHLSVVLDDAAQDIALVPRGEDLFEATQIHCLLQDLLGLPTPVYHHHRLIRDAAGKRLAKRDDARAIATYRADGASPADIRRLVGL